MILNKRRFWFPLCACVIAMGFGIAARQSNDPFARFAHPQNGSTVQAGARVPVTAVAMFADPPADGQLQVSEDQGVTWVDLNFSIQGRSISAEDYVTPANPGAIVKFRTWSLTAAWFTSQIEVFLRQ